MPDSDGYARRSKRRVTIEVDVRAVNTPAPMKGVRAPTGDDDFEAAVEKAIMRLSHKEGRPGIIEALSEALSRRVRHEGLL